MSPHDDMTSSRVLAALTAAGDIAYEWELGSDAIRTLRGVGYFVPKD